MCDFETPTVSQTTTQKARKNYRCYECRKKIIPGELYQRYRGLWDGEWATFKTCSDCVILAEKLMEIEPCGYPLGNLLEWARESGIGLSPSC